MRRPSNDSILQKLVTVSETASLLNVPKKTIYTWAYRKILTPVKIKGTRTVRFHRDEVLELFDSLHLPSANEPDISKVTLETLDNFPRLFKIGLKRMQLTKRNEVWQLSFSFNGERFRKSLGTSDYETALLKISSVVAELLELKGVDGYPGTKKNTLETLMTRFLKFKSGRVEPQTLRRYQVSTNQLLRFFGKDKDVTFLTLDDIERYQADRVNGENVSNTTVNRDIFAVLIPALKKAVQWNVFTRKALEEIQKAIEKLPEPEPRERVYTEEEIERLLLECPKHIRPIVITGLLTGMRTSELIKLKWVDVHLDQVKGKIRVKATKTHRNRTVRIEGKLLMSTLQRLYIERRCEYVFTKSNGKPYLQGFDKGFRAAKKRAGINDATFHDLRRTYGTVLMELGESERVIQKLLGHSRLETTERYLAVKDSHFQGAQRKIDTHFDTLLSKGGTATS